MPTLPLPWCCYTFPGRRAISFIPSSTDDALQLALIPQARVLCLAHVGDDAEVEARLERFREGRRFVLARPGIGSGEDETSAQLDILFLEAAVLVGHREAARLLLRRFAATEMRTTGYLYNTCIARHLGAAAALLGRPDEARGYYRAALEVCREMPFRPEEALTRLQLAELLLDPSASSGQGQDQNRAEALEHLDAAMPEFRDMKMQPSLERAIVLKEKAEAGPVRAPTYPDGLTQREVEVLRAVASGKSNPEVAEELFISLNTVARHLTNIFGKIGVTNRVEAANYAARQGLASDS